MGLVALRAELRAIRAAINELCNAVKEHSDIITTAEKNRRDKPSTIQRVQAAVTFDDETKRDTQTANRIQTSIRLATWCAFGAAIVYAGIAAFQLKGLLDANRINHAALVATQRAYVSVTGLNIARSTFNPKLVSYIVSPIIVNSGNTPTKKLWFTAVFAATPVDVDHQLTVEDLTSATHNYGTLGARQEVRDLIKEPIPAEYAAILRQSNAQKHIPIYGAVVYEDGISDPPVIHVRRYCYSLYVNPYFTSPTGLSYTMCGGRSNCEDEECDEATQQQMKKIRAESKPN